MTTIASTPPVLLLKETGIILREAAVAAYRHNILANAKGAAYSGLLAFFPVLTTAVAILVQANAVQVSRVLTDFLFEAVPPGSETLLEYSVTIRGQRPAYLLVIATLLAAWAASGIIMSLMEGFRQAYSIPQGRPFVKERLVAVGLVFTSALPALAASVLVLFGERVERQLLRLAGFLPGGTELAGPLVAVGLALRLTLELATIAVLTSLLYHFGPNRRQRWLTLWPGALTATLGWWIVTAAFAWYVRNIAHYNVLYGSVGAALALLVWMYLLSVLALFGCEVNAARERFAHKAAALRQHRA
jgi:membrane protein